MLCRNNQRMHKKDRRSHVDRDRSFIKNINYSAPILSHVECYNYDNLRHKKASYEKRNMKRGGTNQNNDPFTWVMDLSIRQKGIKRIWVNK